MLTSLNSHIGVFVLRLAAFICLLLVHTHFSFADDDTTADKATNAKCSALFAGNPEKSIVVLDTNVIVNKPEVIFEYPGADVFIPLKVVEELDNFKTEFSDRGQSTRNFSRTVAKLRNEGSLMDGVALQSGSILRFGSISSDEIKALNLPESFDTTIADNEIIATALHLANMYPDRDVRLISDDVNVLLKSDALELQASPYVAAKKSLARMNIFSGVQDRDVSPESLRELLLKGAIPNTFDGLKANEFVILNSGEESLAVRYEMSTNTLALLQSSQDLDLPVYPRNQEQEMALDILLNKDIQLVTIMGSAGTGKTLMALLAGLRQTVWGKEPIFEEILLTSAFVTMGKDIGALPGDLEQKSSPYMRPFYDNLQFIADVAVEKSWGAEANPTEKPSASSKNQRPFFLKQLNGRQFRAIKKRAHSLGKALHDKAFLREMFEEFKHQFSLSEFDPPVASTNQTTEKAGDYSKLVQGKVNIVAMPFVRGRTWPKRLIIVDEAQNLTLHEVKTLITRAGEGTKIVLMGDVTQIDLPSVNAYSNGLAMVIELFKSEPIAGHITLTKTERSELVETAVRVFEEQEGL